MEEIKMENANTPVSAGIIPGRHSRWWQVVFGVIGMSMITNLQYGWTLFVLPIHDKFGWSRAEIQIAFTIFVLLETWLLPFEGWIIDKIGPKRVSLIGGILVGLAWYINSIAASLAMLYFGAVVGGVGAGLVYATCIGNVLKWFPDRRGLAVGLTLVGFGAGSALTVVPIARMIESSGYQSAFLIFGLIQGFVIIVLSFFFVAPPLDFLRDVKGKLISTKRQFKPAEVLTQPVFWLLFTISTFVFVGGLIAVAQLGPIARDFQIDKIPVTLLGLTLPALTFALTLDRIMNGICRPFFGWVSDKIGRELTMFIAFMFEGLGILALLQFAYNPILFVLLTAAVFFAWGEITTLVPTTATDTFGSQYATAIAGMLYTSKGVAVLLVPLASILVQQTGTWKWVFVIASALNIIAALTAMFILRPLRKRMPNMSVGQKNLEVG
jgi:MFS transporter, OFA family, oxalate/formate antiporter